MLLLFGWTTRTKTLGTGSFYCRNEGGDRTYLLLQARRWFTLFFIPLIPLKVLGDLVQCSSCGVQYDSKVLDVPTNAPVQDEPEAMVRAALSDAGSDGAVSSEELDQIVRMAIELGLSAAHLRGILIEQVSLDEANEAIKRGSLA